MTGVRGPAYRMGGGVTNKYLTDGRKGDWLQTFTGRQFWPLDPRADEVWIEDIAHALGNLCRFGGHCDNFYSVAEHSVYVSYVVPEEIALIGLLHDAAEAYLVDVPRPIKRHLADYFIIEGRLETAIAERFGFDHRLIADPRIKEADNRVMVTEKEQIMKQPPAQWYDPGVGPVQDLRIACWAPGQAREAFLRRFVELVGRDSEAVPARWLDVR